MGNVALCAPSIASSSNAVRVVSLDGRLMIYTRESVKTSEVMLENPGQFLCESCQLKVGQRIQGLCGEEELERGEVYFLLPMEMLYSVLTTEEMKLLSHKACKGLKQVLAVSSVNFSKIFPEFNCLFPNNSDDHQAKRVDQDHSGGIGSCSQIQVPPERFSKQRSWQPALETIIENPSHT